MLKKLTPAFWVLVVWSCQIFYGYWDESKKIQGLAGYLVVTVFAIWRLFCIVEDLKSRLIALEGRRPFID